MLALKCPNCGVEISPDEVTCPNCGVKIGEEVLERLLPLLKKPREEPASPLPVVYRLLVGIVKPNVVFSNIATSPDLVGPFIVALLTASLTAVHFSSALSNLILPDFFSLLISKWISNLLFIVLLELSILFAFLEIFLISFLYWLLLRILGRGSSLMSFISMIGYAYILVVIGKILSIILSSGSPVLLPPLPLLTQLLVLQLQLYSIWSTEKTVKIPCLLGVAFLLTPGIRKVTKLNTSLSLVTSYVVMSIAIIFLSSL